MQEEGGAAAAVEAPPVGRGHADGADPATLGQLSDGRVQTVHVEALVTGIADEEVIGVGRLFARHALLALEAEPGLGFDALHEGGGVLEAARVSAVAALVAGDELFGSLETVLLGRSKAEAADGARADDGCGEGVGADDGHLDEPALFGEVSQLNVVHHAAFDLVGELCAGNEAVLLHNLIVDVAHAGPVEAKRQNG